MPQTIHINLLATNITLLKHVEAEVIPIKFTWIYFISPKRCITPKLPQKFKPLAAIYIIKIGTFQEEQFLTKDKHPNIL